MICSSKRLARALVSVVGTFDQRLRPGELTAIINAFSRLPKKGVAKVGALRAFLRVLSGSWLYTPGAMTGPESDLLADEMGISKQPEDWLTVKTVNAIAVYLVQRVR